MAVNENVLSSRLFKSPAIDIGSLQGLRAYCKDELQYRCNTIFRTMWFDSLKPLSSVLAARVRERGYKYPNH